MFQNFEDMIRFLFISSFITFLLENLANKTSAIQYLSFFMVKIMISFTNLLQIANSVVEKFHSNFKGYHIFFFSIQKFK